MSNDVKYPYPVIHCVDGGQLPYPTQERKELTVEERAVELFEKLYAEKYFKKRMLKLKEECLELVEVIDEVYSSPTDGQLDRLEDEMSDVLGVITHMAWLMKMDLDKLLLMAIDKSERRIQDPDYKRRLKKT